MSLWLSRLFVLIALVVSSVDGIRAGKYDYDETTGEFKKKSKTQAYSVKIVSSREADSKKTPVQSQKKRDAIWSKFHQTRNEIDNLDLWLARFARAIVVELSEMELVESEVSLRLDYRIRREILKRKLAALHEELARAQLGRRFWQRTPTDEIHRAQREAYDAKLRLYDELNGDAFAVYIKTETEEAVRFLVQLSTRNLEEQEVLLAISPEASTLDELEALRSRIDTDHFLIERMQEAVFVEGIRSAGLEIVLDEETYENICVDYARIVEEHQANHEAILALIDSVRQQHGEQSDDEIADVDAAPEGTRGDHAREAFGQATRATIAVAAFPLGIAMTAVRAGYDKTKKTFDDYRAKKRENSERHLAYCAHAEDAFAQLIPAYVSADERPIYEAAFAKYAQREYRYSDIDFVASALRVAQINVKQARLVDELREGIGNLADEDEAHVRMRRAMQRSLRIIQNNPEASSDKRHDPAQIEARIRREEMARRDREEQRIAANFKSHEEKIAKQQAAEARRERNREKTRNAKIEARAKLEKQRQEHALKLQRKREAQAVYRAILAGLRARYHELSQTAFDDDNVDAVMVDLLVHYGASRGSFSAAYVQIFGKNSLKQLIKNTGTSAYEDFWPAIVEKYGSNAEAFIARRNDQQRKSANRVSNLRALRASVHESQHKSDVEQNAHEVLISLFWKAHYQKRKASYEIFGADNLVAMLENHDSYENFVAALTERYGNAVNAFIATRDAERQKAANKERNLLALRAQVNNAQRKPEEERDAQETLIVLFWKGLHDKTDAHAFGHVFRNEDLTNWLERYDSYENFVTGLFERFQEATLAFIKYRTDEKQKAANKARNLQALRVRVDEVQRKPDTEQDVHETLLVLFWKCLTHKKFQRAYGKGVFAGDNLVSLLENHEEFENLLKDLNQRYEAGVLAFQANRDKQLLLDSAKKGLSQKGVAKFRERALLKFRSELDAIGSAFANPNDSTRRTAPQKKHDATSYQETFKRSLNDIIARQPEFKKALDDLCPDEAPEQNDNQDEAGDENDDGLHASNEEMKLTKTQLMEHLQTWYVGFPDHIATSIQVGAECPICYTTLDYDLVFSSNAEASIPPGLLVQRAKSSAHKLSSCGHLLCDACMRQIEARAKLIKSTITAGEIVFAPYFCPLCQTPIPSDELNEKERNRAFGHVVSASTDVAAPLISAGADPQMDLVFVEKVLAAWKNKFADLSERVVAHVVDENFGLTTKRPSGVIKRFRQSEHQQLLIKLLDGTSTKIAELEAAIKQDGATRGVEKWYQSVMALGLSTFVGAEWIVLTPALASKIKKASTSAGRTLLRADKFGFNLAQQSPRNREEMARICQNNETKLCDEFHCHFDVENPPISWSEFRERATSISQAALSYVSDVVTGCQAQIDHFILTSEGDQDLVETIALRVERESEHGDLSLHPDLLAEFKAERKAIKSEFIASVRNQSVNAVKGDQEPALPLESLTSNFRRRLDFVEEKYLLIDDLMRTHEINLQSLTKQAFDAPTVQTFAHIRRYVRLPDSGELKGRMVYELTTKLEKIQTKQLQELLGMSLSTPEDLSAFKTAHETSKANATTTRDESLVQLAQGGMRIPNWDLRLGNLRSEIMSVMTTEIATIEHANRAVPFGRLTPVEHARATLAHHLKEVHHIFAEEFNLMFNALGKELSKATIDQVGEIIRDYIGEDIPKALPEFLACNGKFSGLFSSTWKEVNTYLTAMSSLSGEQHFRSLRASLVSLFAQHRETIRAFDGFVVERGKSRESFLRARLDFPTVVHENFQREAASLKLLLTAMMADVEEMSHDEIDGTSATIHDVTAAKGLIFYVERFHDELPTDAIRKFLVRILRSENINSQFGAHVQYRKLIEQLSKSPQHDAAVAIQTKDEPIEHSYSASSSEHTGFSGIPNKGNTCFANVCIQALARMSVWHQTGQPQAIRSYKRATPNVNAFRDITESLVNMVQKGDEVGIESTLAPFFEHVYKILPNFIGKEPGLQQDAQEFWMDVLDAVGIDDPKLKLPIKFHSSSFIKKEQNSVEGEYTAITPLHALSLPLAGKRTTIKRAMKAWMKPHPFVREGTEDTMYSQVMLYNPPSIMTIVVNRFDAENRKLNIPMSISDITIPFHHYKHPAGLRASENVVYRLVGGIYHNGKTTGSGHYYFIDHITGIVYDDKSTYKLALLDEKIIQKQSYILFFQRVAR